MFINTSSKNKKPTRTLDGFEALRELRDSFGQTAVQEGKNMLTDTLRQITQLEKDVKKLSGELQAGESIDLSQEAQNDVSAPSYPETKDYIQPGIDYYRDFYAVRERPVATEDTKQIQMRIDQIIGELRKLTASSTELAVQFEEVAMEETPVDAGTYHLNFFEWVFSVVQKARERVEESQTWLALFKSKKGQKNYWSMFKKHGTTFGLSNERVVATQTG
jgi:hypothetical protein